MIQVSNDQHGPRNQETLVKYRPFWKVWSWSLRRVDVFLYFFRSCSICFCCCLLWPPFSHASPYVASSAPLNGYRVIVVSSILDQGGACRALVVTLRLGGEGIKTLIQSLSSPAPKGQWSSWWFHHCRQPRRLVGPQLIVVGLEYKAAVSCSLYPRHYLGPTGRWPSLSRNLMSMICLPLPITSGLLLRGWEGCGDPLIAPSWRRQGWGGKG